MKILVCNDDGIFAKGIASLANSMEKLGQVTVVAPDMERSATGHAITMRDPLRVYETRLWESNIKGFSLTGTPADCVKFGINVIMEDNPDLVVSGINRGQNLGTDILYSGTVSAAIEGAILGIPSMAISLASYQDDDYLFAAQTALKIADKMSKYPLPPGTLLNVNIPAIPSDRCKGIKITRMGVRRYKDNYIKRLDPRGKEYYWLGGDLLEQENREKETDITAIEEGYISVTPIHFDLTNDSQLSTLSQWF